MDPPNYLEFNLDKLDPGTLGVGLKITNYAR